MVSTRDEDEREADRIEQVKRQRALELSAIEAAMVRAKLAHDEMLDRQAQQKKRAEAQRLIKEQRAKEREEKRAALEAKRRERVEEMDVEEDPVVKAMRYVVYCASGPLPSLFCFILETDSELCYACCA